MAVTEKQVAAWLSRLTGIGGFVFLLVTRQTSAQVEWLFLIGGLIFGPEVLKGKFDFTIKRGNGDEAA